MKYLVEQHSLQVVPGALSLIGYLTGASRGFRGVSGRDAGKKSEHSKAIAVERSKPNHPRQGSAARSWATYQVTGGLR